MLVTLDRLEGLRAWRDFLVSSRKSLGARGCPIGSLGSELAEANTDVRARIAASFRAGRTRSAPRCAACKPAASWAALSRASSPRPARPGLVLLKVGEVGGGQALQCHAGQRALSEAAADALAEHHG